MSTADGTIVGKTKLLDHGADDRRWVLVIMGDGYQAAELGQFAADAQRFVSSLLATFPFNELETAINVYRIDVSSTNSGARDPAACGDGSVGSGAAPRTFFDATFCSNNIRRLLTITAATARSTATAQVGRWNQILVIVNSAQYGG